MMRRTRFGIGLDVCPDRGKHETISRLDECIVVSSKLRKKGPSKVRTVHPYNEIRFPGHRRKCE